MKYTLFALLLLAGCTAAPDQPTEQSQAEPIYITQIHKVKADGEWIVADQITEVETGQYLELETFNLSGTDYWVSGYDVDQKNVAEPGDLWVKYARLSDKDGQEIRLPSQVAVLNYLAEHGYGLASEERINAEHYRYTLSRK